MDRDRMTLLIALGEVVALEHARNRVLSRKTQHAFGAELVQPAGVEFQTRLFWIEDLGYLRLVGLGVLLDLGARQRLAGLILSRRISDHPGEVADQEDDVVPTLLERPELVQQ